MNKPLIYTSLLFLLLFLLASCDQVQVGEDVGTLEGQVSIGPLVPVVQEGEEAPTPAPEVYAEREIVVFEENGKTEVTRLKLDSTGNYQAELPVGIYVVDINRIGIDTADGFPKKITITADAVIRVDVDIDTGIR
jgi:hypothetical protein